MRIFLTGYNPEGESYEFGKECSVKMKRFLKYKSELCSKISKTKNKRLLKGRKAGLLRLNEKIRNIVDDFHKKYAKCLTI